MSNKSSKPFNPYHRWLGISAKDCPPNHYRLLGIDEFETDEDVIESAADRQMRHVRSYQSGKNGDLSQRIMNELSAAKVCLFNSEKKAEYDRELRAEKARKVAAQQPPTAPPQAPQKPQVPIAVSKPTQPVPIVASQIPSAQPVAKPAFPATAVRQYAQPSSKSAGKPNTLLIVGIVGGVIAIGLVSVIGIVLAITFSGDRDANNLVNLTANETTKKGGTITSPLESKKTETKTETKDATNRAVTEKKKSAGPIETKQAVQNETAGALLDVERMKMVPYAKPEQLPDRPSKAYTFDWVTDPKTDTKNGLLVFSVKESGVVYLVTSTEYQGNPSGGWTKDRVTKQQLVQQGWTDLGKCPWKQKESLLKRNVSAGDEFRIRMNKYGPPALIVPGPLSSDSANSDTASKTGSADVSSNSPVLKGTHVLRLGNEGGIELADTKGFLHPDRPTTIEFWARLDVDAKAINLVGDRVLGNKFPELDNQEGGVMVAINRRDSGQLLADIMTRSGGGSRRLEIAPNEWSHFAFSIDSEKIRFFVNGKLVSDRASKAADWTPGPLNVHIGFHRFLFFSLRNGFNGELRDVRLSSVCRYDDEFSPPEKFTLDDDTEALLKFTDPSSDRIEDLSGKNHQATITGGEWIQTE